MTPQERLAVRNERSRPLVSELETWLRQQRAKLSAKNETAKAIHYSLKRWTALSRFLDDGRLCMSNNAAERAVRCVAVGRKNWTFAGSDEGGHRAAAIYTLIETAKLNDIDPQAWLADVLARLPDHPATPARSRARHQQPPVRIQACRLAPAFVFGKPAVCTVYRAGGSKMTFAGAPEVTATSRCRPAHARTSKRHRQRPQ
jgi:hypothetical protein